MIKPKPRVIELTEFEPRVLTRDELSEEEGESLWRDYPEYVSVESPSFKTGGRWRLTPSGWVGFIPLTESLTLSLRPRIKLHNLFGMLEYAFKLKSFRSLKGLTESQSLEEFYSRLARTLAGGVLERSRRGLHRSYIAREDRLPYLAGRIDLNHMLRRPAGVNLWCRYQEHSLDIEDNQILAWTLQTLARGRLRGSPAGSTVRQAHRVLHGPVKLKEFSAQDCVGRHYHRLNDDYETLHALCRFFLENSGPSHHIGDRKMTPFLVSMPRLFELFVAEWLKTHLPAEFRVRPQEKIKVSSDGMLNFIADLIVYETATGRARCVIDTKYKSAAKPTADDVAQVIAYASATGCRDAVLAYPIPVGKTFEGGARDIRVRNLAFSLEGDLEEAGRNFLNGLL